MRAATRRHTANRRRAGLTVESLEPRALLSTAPTLAAARPAAEVRVVKRISDRTYSRAGSKLDVYVPTRAAAPDSGWPAIVAMPGGGWQWASKDSYGRALGGLVKAGYVVVAIDYTYASPGGRSTWPANLNDVRNAIRWVRRNADKLNIDPNRLATIGESAGGHLAALAAVVPDGPLAVEGANPAPSQPMAGQVSTRVQAAVVFYGPTDLTLEWAQQPETHGYLSAFLGGSPARRAGRYIAASPISHVSSDDPPTFIVQGTADNVIDESQSTLFADALRAAGVPVTLKFLPGVPHGFRFRQGSANMRELIAFLDGVLKS